MEVVARDVAPGNELRRLAGCQVLHRGLLWAVLAGAVALAACRGRGPLHGGSGQPADASRRDAVLPADAGDSVGADLPNASPPPPPEPDGGPPPSPDAAAFESGPGDRTGADLAEKYRQLMQSAQDRYDRRLAECFGGPLELITNVRYKVDLPEFLRQSLQLGLVRLDEAAARTCLETLAAASCAQIAEIFARGGPTDAAAKVPGCTSITVGTVPPGQACLVGADCASPERFTCGGSDRCRVCAPLPTKKLRDPCSPGAGDCPPGAVCRPEGRGSSDDLCLPAAQEGAPCHEHPDCGPGLLCALTGPDAVLEGTCRSTAVGTPCAGNWECLYVHVCAGAGPGRQGTCQVGKRAGEPCNVHGKDVNGNQYSDCAFLLECLDLDGRGRRCVAGHNLGETCGPAPTENSWVPCLEGHCTATSTSANGTCVPYKRAGEPCQTKYECQSGLDCLRSGGGSAVCGRRGPAPLGQDCDPSAPDRPCGLDAYCAVAPDFDSGGFTLPRHGTCTPLLWIGDPCRRPFDECEPLAMCMNGVCRRC